MEYLKLLDKGLDDVLIEFRGISKARLKDDSLLDKFDGKDILNGIVEFAGKNLPNPVYFLFGESRIVLHNLTLFLKAYCIFLNLYFKRTQKLQSDYLLEIQATGTQKIKPMKPSQELSPVVTLPETKRKKPDLKTITEVPDTVDIPRVEIEGIHFGSFRDETFRRDDEGIPFGPFNYFPQLFDDDVEALAQVLSSREQRESFQEQVPTIPVEMLLEPMPAQVTEELVPNRITDQLMPNQITEDLMPNQIAEQDQEVLFLQPSEEKIQPRVIEQAGIESQRATEGPSRKKKKNICRKATLQSDQQLISILRRLYTKPHFWETMLFDVPNKEQDILNVFQFEMSSSKPREVFCEELTKRISGSPPPIALVLKWSSSFNTNFHENENTALHQSASDIGGGLLKILSISSSQNSLERILTQYPSGEDIATLSFPQGYTFGDEVPDLVTSVESTILGITLPAELKSEDALRLDSVDAGMPIVESRATPQASKDTLEGISLGSNAIPITPSQQTFEEPGSVGAVSDRSTWEGVSETPRTSGRSKEAKSRSWYIENVFTTIKGFCESSGGSVAFAELCIPGCTNRKEVCRIFYAVLCLGGSQRIKMKQEVPFDPNFLYMSI